MYNTVYAAERLEQQRAAALDRDLELRRRILDRGTTITPSRPAVNPLRDLGVWLHNHRSASRVRVSY